MELSEDALQKIDLEYGDGRRAFFVPRTENQFKTVQEIFAGTTFPTPPVDRSSIDCVFDIGANIGAASVYFNLTYPNAQIHAFEPNRMSSPVLMQNTQGLERIAIHSFGLAGGDGSADIQIGGGGGETSSIKGCFEPTGSHPIELRNAGRVLPELAEGAGHIVVKIDTEGCEAEILEAVGDPGDPGDFYGRVICVYLEYHSESQRRRIDRVMTENGFLVFSAACERPHRGDMFYLREDIAAEIPYLDRYRLD